MLIVSSATATRHGCSPILSDSPIFSLRKIACSKAQHDRSLARSLARSIARSVVQGRVGLLCHHPPVKIWPASFDRSIAQPLFTSNGRWLQRSIGWPIGRKITKTITVESEFPCTLAPLSLYVSKAVISTSQHIVLLKIMSASINFMRTSDSGLRVQCTKETSCGRVILCAAAFADVHMNELRT